MSFKDIVTVSKIKCIKKKLPVVFIVVGTEDNACCIETCLPKKNKGWLTLDCVTMSYAKLLHSVPDGLRKLYRQYENVSKKLINTKWSIEFNSTCIKE